MSLTTRNIVMRKKLTDAITGHLKKGGIVKGSITAYLGRYKRIHLMMFPEQKEIKSLTFLKKKPKSVIQKIKDNKMPENSKLALYSAILKLIGDNNGSKYYKREFMLLAGKIKENTKKQEKNDDDDSKWLTTDELNKGRTVLYDVAKASGKDKDYLDHLIYTLYSLLPPRRADFAEMKVDCNDNYEGNCVKTKNGIFDKFIFKHYKLSHKKGTQTFTRAQILNLPNGKEILTILDDWLNRNKGEYFLIKKYTYNSFVKKVQILFNKIHKKNTSINTLRHIYISKLLDLDPPLKQKEEIANFMSHSTFTQQLYRKRNENNGEKVVNLK